MPLRIDHSTAAIVHVEYPKWYSCDNTYVWMTKDVYYQIRQAIFVAFWKSQLNNRERHLARASAGPTKKKLVKHVNALQVLYAGTWRRWTYIRLVCPAGLSSHLTNYRRSVYHCDKFRCYYNSKPHSKSQRKERIPASTRLNSSCDVEYRCWLIPEAATSQSFYYLY